MNIYLEYQISDGYVVKTYGDMPSSFPSGHGIVVTSAVNLKVGDEYNNAIMVDVDANGNLLSLCMVKQPQSVTYLTQQLLTANGTIKDLQDQNAQMLLALVTGGLM